MLVCRAELEHVDSRLWGGGEDGAASPHNRGTQAGGRVQVDSVAATVTVPFLCSG